MIEQLELYDYFDKVVWNKPLRLCELYGGIGSQHKALTNLGINISEHYLVEVDINATISYAAIHCDLNSHLDDEVPSDSDMIEYLRQFNFWSNEKPYDVAKLPKAKLKTLYLARQLSNNLGDVYQLDDLPPVDLITWSTPCQDFSNAGLKKGFDGAKGGLTFITLELFRKLSHKPTFLLFENVPMIVSEVFRDGFNRMLIELNELGYENVVMKLNAKDYGIPQNRDRVFVLSIRKDYHANYSTPKPMPLELRLKDMLQDEVDERFYLSDTMMEYMTSMDDRNGFIRGERFSPHDDTSKYAYAVTTNAGNRVTDNFVIVPEATQKGYVEAYEGDGVYIDRPHQKRRVVQKGMIQTLSTTPQSDVGVIVHDIKQQVTVRSHEVNVEKLKAVLHKHKNKTNKELAELLDKPLTLVEHWFRNDKSFSIPTQDVWYQLKSILQIDTDEFDKSITTFEQKDNVFEKSNRVYDTTGLAPTITSTTADEKIYNDLRIRKLTPLETWRLMGFTDDDFAKAERHHSNSALYKQAGNSIVVQVLENIFKGLFYESTTI